MHFDGAVRLGATDCGQRGLRFANRVQCDGIQPLAVVTQLLLRLLANLLVRQQPPNSRTRRPASGRVARGERAPELRTVLPRIHERVHRRARVVHRHRVIRTHPGGQRQLHYRVRRHRADAYVVERVRVVAAQSSIRSPAYGPRLTRSRLDDTERNSPFLLGLGHVMYGDGVKFPGSSMRIVALVRTAFVMCTVGSAALCGASDATDQRAGLTPMLLDLAIAVAAVVVAVVGVLIKRRMDERNLDFERDQALIRWANEVLDTMAKWIGFTFCDPGRMGDGVFFDERRRLLAALSAQIDRGRLFFSNDLKADIGENKDSAFQGLRPEVLTQIVLAHDTIKSLSAAWVDASERGNDNRERRRLSAAMVRSAGPGNYVDGNGLMLRVRKSGTLQWIQRLMIHGRRVDLGLGSADLVKLADARKVAADNRAVARTGGDPAARGCRRSRRPRRSASRRSGRRGGRTARRTTGARRWTATWCRGTAACRWTRGPARRSTMCCVPSRWPASTPRPRWRGRRSRRCWSGRGSTGSAPRARRWRRCAAGCRSAPGARSTTTRCVGAHRRRAVHALDEAGDPVHRADRLAAGGDAARDLGPVRPGGGGVGQARGGGGADSYCRDGDTIEPGDRCEIYTTRVPFDVSASGRGCVRAGGINLFSGNSISRRNTTLNGERMTFVSDRNGDDSWTIEDIDPEPSD